MKEIVNNYLHNGGKLTELYIEYKKDFKSYGSFCAKVNTYIEENHCIKPVGMFEKSAWIYKNEGIWHPATYEELSISEKAMHDARDKKFIP